ncbi:hypothetical protein [Leyella stercorea]|uniref:hypothetical protein n=1 Tax=Leyella stercorea TaxID=363265 RepID=UPI0024311D2E|nr:hypothetical protein [Leyella stercorea]
MEVLMSGFNYPYDEYDDDFDQDIIDLCKMIEENEEGNIYLNNPIELSKMEIVETIIKKTVNTDELKITKEVNEPFITSGGIGVEGKSIKISNPKLFTMILKLSDNIEFFPKTNGNVEMGIAFSGIAVKIGSVE